MNEALIKAIDIIGGPAVTARQFNISVQAVSKWKKAPANRVIEIEKMSGISRHDLRPDIFGPPVEAA